VENNCQAHIIHPPLTGGSLYNCCIVEPLVLKIILNSEIAWDVRLASTSSAVNKIMTRRRWYFGVAHLSKHVGKGDAHEQPCEYWPIVLNLSRKCCFLVHCEVGRKQYKILKGAKGFCADRCKIFFLERTRPKALFLFAAVLGLLFYSCFFSYDLHLHIQLHEHYIYNY